ncbi:unnamed protein product [Parnassius apollo]|uniref:(apollo) hypothetical protein n=1 Tax=Parnassius apollo TaxID=110799 RepID=A0A8S3XSL1_PARAO|nr:unnamed protein product [Parnassius apollo]
MATTKHCLDVEYPTSTKQPRTNVNSQHFERFVMENVIFSESDDSSADENDILPPEAEEAEVDSSSDSDENISLVELLSDVRIEKNRP